MSNGDFILRVLRIATRAECVDDLIWRMGDDPVFATPITPSTSADVSAYVNCNDVFEPAADYEQITPENVDAWETALAEARALPGISRHYGNILFVTRLRKKLPQQTKRYAPDLAALMIAAAAAEGVK